MNHPSSGRKFAFWILVGMISVVFVEVPAGSTMLPFWTVWGLLVVLPPIVDNEDDKAGPDAVAALRVSVENGASYGLMLEHHNQRFPFHFDGAAGEQDATQDDL